MQHLLKYMMNSTLTSNESDLIRELKSGSKKAFDTIYMMYFKRLYAYCFRFTKSKEDAEEIVHDVFLRLWKMREDIRQEETLRSLLFIISKSYLIKSFHKRIDSQIFEDYLNYKDYISANEITDYDLEYNDFLDKVREEMEKLPETQKKVIELSKIKQFSIQETAQCLSLSEQTVRNQLSIGLRSLNLLIKKEVIIFLLILKDTLF